MDFGRHAGSGGGFEPAIGRGAGQGDGLLGAEPVHFGTAHFLRGRADAAELCQAGCGNDQVGLCLCCGRHRPPGQFHETLPDLDRQIAPANDGRDHLRDGLPQQSAQPLDLGDAAAAQYVARALIAGRPGVIEDRAAGGQHGPWQGAPRGAGEVGADHGGVLAQHGGVHRVDHHTGDHPLAVCCFHQQHRRLRIGRAGHLAAVRPHARAVSNGQARAGGPAPSLTAAQAATIICSSKKRR